MTRVSVPNGQVGLAHFIPMQDPTYGNRTQWFTYELLDTDGAPKGALSGVTGGTLEWHASASVKGGGRITVQQASRSDHNWLKRRVKIVMHIEGLGKTPLGVFIPSAPSENWDDLNLSLELDLLDTSSILDNDYMAQTYTVPAGTVVTERVRDIIWSAGENAGAITHTADTLAHSMTWEAGTSKLEIINDLLSAANFFSLRADGHGRFRVEKYQSPAIRPVVARLYDNDQSIYSPVFTYEKDHWSVPNKVIFIGQGSGEEEALTSVVTNENPNSPYSYQNRGHWIVDVTSGVEATDQGALDAQARKRLAEVTSPTGTLSIDHAPLPSLTINDAVKFRRNEADIDIRATVQSTQISLDATALQRTELQEVVSL